MTTQELKEKFSEIICHDYVNNEINSYLVTLNLDDNDSEKKNLKEKLKNLKPRMIYERYNPSHKDGTDERMDESWQIELFFSWAKNLDELLENPLGDESDPEKKAEAQKTLQQLIDYGENIIKTMTEFIDKYKEEDIKKVSEIFEQIRKEHQSWGEENMITKGEDLSVGKCLKILKEGNSLHKVEEELNNYFENLREEKVEDEISELHNLRTEVRK